MMSDKLTIGKQTIGPGQPCFVIAEAGVNHNGDMLLAHQLIDAAADSGADAVKFQSFVTEELITRDAQKANYQVATTGSEGSQYEMLKALELRPAQQAELKRHCEDQGLIYICTPYEETSVDMLVDMDVGVIKIASTDTNNIPFLRYVGRQGIPVIYSTGMSTLGEIEMGLQALNAGGLTDEIVVLHCTSEYPAPMEDINLRAIQTIHRAFGYLVGFSDHTPGVGASPWAVALGACVVEKHFSLDRTMTGPDHRASIEPDELKTLVRTIREVETAMGDGIKRIAPSEKANKPRMQKSLVLRRAVKAGEVIKPEDLTTKRPGDGLSPSWFDHMVGKTARIDLSKDTTLNINHVI